MMGLFDKIREPVILKESSSAKIQIEALKNLLITAPTAMRANIEQDIKFLQYGQIGEERILYELKNSHTPMYVLHDLFLEHNGLTAQIDFIVVTEKITFVIESKNLFGNIEITANGDFVRTMNYGTRYQKEGIYSPVTQNQRHLELLKQIGAHSRSHVISKTLFEKVFYDFYKGVVVLANPKTVLNDKYAKKEIKDQVIRADQLISYIKQANKGRKEFASSDKEMRNSAENILELHTENPVDYLKKYQQESSKPAPVSIVNGTATPQNKEITEKEQSPLYKKLRNWRYQQAQKEGIKPYYIFYNTTLDELVEKSLIL